MGRPKRRKILEKRRAEAKRRYYLQRQSKTIGACDTFLDSERFGEYAFDILKMRGTERTHLVDVELENRGQALSRSIDHTLRKERPSYGSTKIVRRVFTRKRILRIRS